MKRIELRASAVFPELIMVEDEHRHFLHALGDLVNDLKSSNDWCLKTSSFLSLLNAAMQAPMQRPSGCRALLPTGAGPLLTGSSDGAVRLWDASRPEASYMVCGLPQMAATDLPGASAGPGSGRAQAGQHMPAQATVPVSYAYTHKTIQGVEVVEESCISRIAESPVSLHGSDS